MRKEVASCFVDLVNSSTTNVFPRCLSPTETLQKDKLDGFKGRSSNFCIYLRNKSQVFLEYSCKVLFSE